MNEKTLTKALLAGKCPVCREGDIFKYPPLRITHFAAMNPRCQVCGTNFEPEPGFYYGAMFISYAFNVALIVAVGLALYYFIDLSELYSLILVAFLAVILTPFSFRYSRILWLYWFGGYRYRPDQKV